MAKPGIRTPGCIAEVTVRAKSAIGAARNLAAIPVTTADLDLVETSFMENGEWQCYALVVEVMGSARLTVNGRSVRLPYQLEPGDKIGLFLPTGSTDTLSRTRLMGWELPEDPETRHAAVRMVLENR